MTSGVWIVAKGKYKFVIIGGDEQLAIEVACIRWNETMPWPAEEREFEAEEVVRPEGHTTFIALEGWVDTNA